MIVEIGKYHIKVSEDKDKISGCIKSAYEVACSQMIQNGDDEKITDDAEIADWYFHYFINLAIVNMVVSQTVTMRKSELAEIYTGILSLLKGDLRSEFIKNSRDKDYLMTSAINILVLPDMPSRVAFFNQIDCSDLFKG